jgi:nitrite reductase/ring-hydroxylating ferredoxin subunit
MTERAVLRFVADLLRGRRPRRFAVNEQQAAELRAAILLRAARPGAGAPREEFVTQLHRRLTRHLAQTQPPTTAQPLRPDPLSIRRRGLVAAAGIAAGAAVGAGIDHTLAGGARANTGAQETLSPNDGQWRTIAASAELPEGATAGFDLGSVNGFVTRTGGALLAVSGECTHLGCRLALNAPAKRLDCPCHTASFALGGQLLHYQLAVAPRPLPRLSAREHNGTVQIFAPPAQPA